MSTYKLTPGNIASVLRLSDAIAKAIPNGEWTCIYIGPSKPIEAYKGNNMARECFADLPQWVRDAVGRHFAAVFALPVDRREAYLKACLPFYIQWPGACPNA